MKHIWITNNSDRSMKAGSMYCLRCGAVPHCESDVRDGSVYREACPGLTEEGRRLQNLPTVPAREWSGFAL